MLTVSGIGFRGLGLGLNSGVSVAKSTEEPTVASRANNVYSFLDIYGNGNDVCQLYNGTSNPTGRDFTADELTDGTYNAWYNSGTTLVTS
jgi:hypothetical protein